MHHNVRQNLIKDTGTEMGNNNKRNILLFWDPLSISATAEATTSPFWEFWDPSISLERLKLEIPNFACRMIVSCRIVKKNKNFGEKGWPGGHVTIFGNFGTPSISRQRLKLEI